MKIILKQDVKTIGKKDEIHEVSDGYARNFLFPRNLAAPADAAALNQARTKSEAKAHHEAEARAAAEELAAKIKGQVVTAKVKGGASGKLYGKVTGKEVAELLTALTGTEIDKKKVELPSAIKEFGSYDASVRLYAGVVAPFKLKVEELGLDVPEERFPGLLAEVKKQATAAGRLMSDDEFRQLVKRPAGAA